MMGSIAATSPRGASRGSSARAIEARAVMSLFLPTPMRIATRWLAVIAIFAMGAWLQARGTLPSILQYWPDVLYLSRQHLWLVGLSGAIAIAIGLPLGILLT